MSIGDFEILQCIPLELESHMLSSLCLPKKDLGKPYFTLLFLSDLEFLNNQEIKGKVEL